MKRIRGIVLLISLFGIFTQASPQLITLEQCIDSALSRNPQIKQASNEVVLSKASVNLARSVKYFSVYSENSAGYSNESSSGNHYETASAGVFAEQLLWQKNKAGFSIDEAKQSGIASEAEFEARVREIRLSVRLTYFECIEQEWLFRVAGENVSRAGLFVDYARERFKAGTARKSDILKAESDLSEALFEQNTFLNSLKRSRNELSMLSGIPSDNLNELDSTWIDEPAFDFQHGEDTVGKSALSEFPEYRAMMSLVTARQAKINQAHSDLYPRLLLNAGYQWVYTPAFESRDTWFTTLTLRWNIFKGREYQYRIQSETIRKSILENQAEQVKMSYMKEFTNRQISLAEAAEKIELTKDLISTTAANLETATAQFLTGTGSMLELVDARVSHLQANQSHIRAITEYRMAAARLEQLTGINIQKN